MCNQRSQIRGPGRMEESTTTPNPVPFELPLLPSIVSTQGRSEDKGEPGVWSKGRSEDKGEPGVWSSGFTLPGHRAGLEGWGSVGCIRG